MKKERIEKAGCKVVIAQSVYDNTHKDFKGEQDGRRSWMPPFSLFNTSCRLIEGQTLDIIPDKTFTKVFGY